MKRKIISVITVFVLLLSTISISNLASAATTIGTTTVGSTNNSSGANDINAFRYQSASAITVTTMKVYLAAAVTGKMKLAIYSDNNGTPGTLLKATNEITNPVAGWNTFTLTSSEALTSGAYYWLCEWANAAYTTKCSTTGGTAKFTTTTYGGSWPAGTSINQGPYTTKDSIYADVGSTPTPTPTPTATPGASENMFGSKTGVAATDSISYELGTIFQSSTAGQILGVRVYGVTGESGAHTVRIWSNANNTVVAGPYTFTFTGSNSWQTFTLPAALNITAGTQYTVAVSTGTDSGKYYPVIVGDMSSAGNNGNHLSWIANAGVYTATAGLRPTSSWNGSNYLRDVVFVSTGGATPTPTPTPTTTPTPTPTPTPMSGFPNASNTGVPAGTSLTTTTVTTPPSNSTQTGKHFTNGLDLSNSHNVIFQSCKVTGIVHTGYEASTSYGNEFYDCEIDANMSADPIIRNVGIKMRRCYIWNGCQGAAISTGILDIEDCYIDNLYGSGDMHCECLLLNALTSSRVVHNTLFGNFLAGGQNDNSGMSSALSLYAHGDYWGPTDNLLVENNLFQSKDAYYPVYWGTWSDSGDNGEVTNCRLINNKFRKIDTYSGWAADIIYDSRSWGTGTVISGNVYEGTSTPVYVVPSP